MSVDQRRSEGFVAFFRNYTKTWVHAVSTAGLTAFGLLTTVNRWFVVLALAAYVVPPVALYFAHGPDAADVVEGRRGSETNKGELESETGTAADRSESGGTERAETGPNTDAGRNSSDPTTDVEPTADSGTDTDPPANDVTDDPTADDVTDDPTADDVADDPTAADVADDPGVDAATDDEGAPIDGAAEPAEWARTDAPTEEDLRDVALAAGGACAVGDGGVALVGDREGWTVQLTDGPAAGGNDLTGVDASADGAAVWVAGDSGALARIDAETWRHTDYTAPADITDNWSGVAVGGPAGDETILLVNGSGQVLRGEFDDDGPSWESPIKPGSGSSISAVDLVDASLGYCCDTNDGVFVTTDGGESFEHVGVDGASGTLTDVAGGGRDDCLATADDGVVHRYDARTWTPDRLHDNELAGVARRGDRAVACGEDAVFERHAPADDWERREFEDAALYGVAAGEERAIAVGEDGSVVARGGFGRSTDGQ